MWQRSHAQGCGASRVHGPRRGDLARPRHLLRHERLGRRDGRHHRGAVAFVNSLGLATATTVVVSLRDRRGPSPRTERVLRRLHVPERGAA
ncbi:hypothetical protein NKG05_29680 [Oerskovia sp. M15]